VRQDYLAHFVKNYFEIKSHRAAPMKKMRSAGAPPQRSTTVASASDALVRCLRSCPADIFCLVPKAEFGADPHGRVPGPGKPSKMSARVALRWARERRRAARRFSLPGPLSPWPPANGPHPTSNLCLAWSEQRCRAVCPNILRPKGRTRAELSLESFS
jgi:hypothetical protein